MATNTVMFKVNCAYCGKPGFAYAKDKQGTLPVYYCSDKCKGAAMYEKRVK